MAQPAAESGQQERQSRNLDQPEVRVEDQTQRGQQGGDRGSEPKARSGSPRRKRAVRLIILAIIVVAIIVAIPIYAYYSVRVSTDDAQVDGHVMPISPRIAGVILNVLVNDNEQVKAGQELVELDPADYKVALQQAEARLASAKASVLESQQNVPITNINTRSQVSTTSSEVKQNVAAVHAAEQAVNGAKAKLNATRAQAAQAEANSVKAQKDLARFQDLVKKDEISKQDYDAAVAAAQATTAKVDTAKAQIVVAQRELDQTQAQVDQAKAALGTARVHSHQSQQIRSRQHAVSEARYQQALAMVKQRQADLAQAKLNASYTIIRAPADGIVSRKSAEPGMHVAPGQEIMAIIPLADVWITANFKETQLKGMRVGQKVEISVDALGGRKFRGHIDSIAAASGAKFSLLPPENATGNYVKVVQRIPVKIVLEPGEDPNHQLRPGMSVEPTVLLNSGTHNAL
ncbi:MAG TPA: HlyD family secretion protein [Bryobacteraceae bacterium]